MGGTVILVQGARPKVRRLDNLRGEMGFTDPGTLLMRQDNGNGVASRL